MSKILELAREAGAYYTYVDPYTGRESLSLPERCFGAFYTLARADLEAENAALKSQAEIQYQHDTKEIETLNAENAKLRSLTEQYIEFMGIAIDWNLSEVEIGGEMVSTYDLIDAARAALGEK